MTAKFWVGGTGTWDNSTTTHWALSSNGAGGAAVPVTADTVTFDGSSGGGTVTVDSTVNGLSLTSLVAGAFTGTLDFSVNNPSMTFTTTATGMNLSGAGTGRIFKLGAGTFTLSNGGFFDFSTTTGAGVQSMASATIVLNSTTIGGQQSFNGGGFTYGTVTINGRSSGQGATIAQANTIGTLNLSGPLVMSISAAQTITNLNVSGSSSAYVMFPEPTAQNTTVTLTVTTATIDRAALRGVVFATAVPAATNSFDLGNNNMNGGSITPPAGGGGVIGS